MARTSTDLTNDSKLLVKTIIDNKAPNETLVFDITFVAKANVVIRPITEYTDGSKRLGSIAAIFSTLLTRDFKATVNTIKLNIALILILTFSIILVTPARDTIRTINEFTAGISRLGFMLAILSSDDTRILAARENAIKLIRVRIWILTPSNSLIPPTKVSINVTILVVAYIRLSGSKSLSLRRADANICIANATPMSCISPPCIPLVP